MRTQRTKSIKAIAVLMALALGAGAFLSAGASQSSAGAAQLTPSAQELQQENSGHTFIIKRLPESAKGNALLMLQLPGDKRPKTLTLALDDVTVVLRDDGQDGDEKAGDGRLSTVISVDFADITTAQKKVLSEHIERNASLTVPAFRGRVKIGDEPLFLPVSGTELAIGEEIVITPIGTGVAIDPARSLLITHPSVVEDPTRTFNPCTRIGTPMGKWTFGYLMQQMANQAATGINPSDFVRRWLSNWEVNTVVNGWPAAARQRVKDIIIDPWVAISGGPGQPLDLAEAPFKLLAIVNRIDLRGNGGYQISGAGEARFVFGAIDRRDPTGCCVLEEMTVIFEYGIDRRDCVSVRNWARQWVNLSTLPLGSPAYNAALEAITEQFARAGVAPHKVNGSALNQLRTNEFLPPQTGPWELREFRLTMGPQDPVVANGQLLQTTAKQTPAEVLNNRSTLSNYINANCGAILTETHVVPLTFPRAPADAGLPNPPAFLDNTVFVPPNFWNAPGLICGPNPPNDARFFLSLNTCNGCHLAETATAFYHIRPTNFGAPAALSAFLSGPIIVNDPVNGTPRAFDEMARRAMILDQLANLLCPIIITPTDRLTPVLFAPNARLEILSDDKAVLSFRGTSVH